MYALRERGCFQRPSAREGELSPAGSSYPRGDFVPIEMAKNDKERHLVASVHVPGHFKVQGMEGFYANCSASLARSERIKRFLDIADTHYIGDSVRPHRRQQQAAVRT